jgi:hypothetical protein
MKRLSYLTLAAALVGTVMINLVQAETQKFQVNSKVSLCGIELEEGEYGLEMREGKAVIYKGKELLVTAEARVEPIEHRHRNCVICCSAILMEVRFKDVRVIFTKPLSRYQSHTGR